MASACSVVASLLITLVANLIATGEVRPLSLIVAAAAAGTIAPAFSAITLKLYFRLSVAEEQLRAMAITDELTQSYNRRFFLEVSSQQLARARRYGETFSVILFDIDDFKAINDRYGHLVGDQVLCSLAKLCRGGCRASDVFARFGGEEFVFLLPHTDAQQALKVAERVRTLVASMSTIVGEHVVQVTASIGVATFRQDEPELTRLLARADQALYAAKSQGKNSVSG